MNQFKRQHPAWILLEIGSFIKSLFFVILFLFILQADTDTGWIVWARYAFWIIAVCGLLYILLKWYTSTYELKEEAIVLHEGVFVKKLRTTTYERIQDHHIQTNFIHKLLGLTSIKLETGTTDDDSTLTFAAVSLEEADRILEFVQRKNSNRVDDQTEEEINEKNVYFRSTQKDNLKAALTSFSFLAIIPLIAAVYSNIDDFFDVEKSTKTVYTYFMDHLELLVPLAVIALLLSFGIGYIQTVIKYGDYEIAGDDTRIYISKGVLNRTTFSIQKSRVQAITIKQSLIKRILGMAEVKVVSAGQTESKEQEISSLYPFLPKHEAYLLTNKLLPDYHIEEKMIHLPKKVLGLRLIRPYYWTIAAIIGLFIVKKEWIWVAVGVFAIELILRILNYKFTSYLQNETFIQVRNGGLVTETFLTKRKNIQQIQIRYSWLQRKFDVATLEFINRSKPIVITTLPDVPKETIVNFHEWYKNNNHEKYR
jgi:putative membrane protein